MSVFIRNLVAGMCLLGFSYQSFGQLKNDVSLVIAPLKFEEQSSYQLLYKRSLKKKDIKLRVGARVLVDTDYEIRSDTVSRSFGTIQYDLSAGVQKDFKIEGLKKISLYVAADGYLNSEFNKQPNETYYGYFWSFGFKPLTGIYYTPFQNIRLSLESRANLNVNLQEYNADKENKDRNISFRPMDNVAVGFGYLF